MIIKTKKPDLQIQETKVVAKEEAGGKQKQVGKIRRDKLPVANKYVGMRCTVRGNIVTSSAISLYGDISKL